MKISVLFLVTAIACFSCEHSPKTATTDAHLREKSDWIHLDVKKDSVPGISLDLAFEELISGKKGDEVIVAMIDQQVDINHEDLKGRIYINPKELPNNDIDDDRNGYVDDLYGWNFLGYDKLNYERYLSYAYIRVIRALANRFEGKSESDIGTSELKDYKRYQEALKKYKKKKGDERYIKTALEVKKEFRDFIKTFSDRLPAHEDYTISQLDSLETINGEEEQLVAKMKKNIGWGYTFEYTYKDEENLLIELYTLNNPEYDERSNIGDNPNDLESVGYGNGNVDAPSHVSHGTQVAGVLAATRNNGIGVRGVSNNIKIMPLVVSPEYGNKNDKDIANAIRYAVDNGAKIINLSGGKSYVENIEILFSALKYAENHGVLFITSAGNNGRDIDKPENTMYLTDKLNKNDTVGNVIRVSATTKNLDATLFDPRVNYGKENVDLFAPGIEIMTTDTRVNRYSETSGSSLSAALTSGVAALLFSYYPDLNYKQIKHILLESGTSYDFLVTTRDKDSVPFKDLSKSGKVLNAYNALKMAKEISGKKK